MNVVAPAASGASVAPGARVIIDTQTVLDWRLFRDPACALWTPPGRSWQWLACAPMRQELTFVLSRAWPDRWAAPSEVLAFFDCHASLQSAPQPGGLRCTDRDDQVFIDLAIAHAPSTLLTRDKALLRLAKRALPLGVVVRRPGDWHPP